ncbi:MAG: PAS-domain containing protein [Alphaproteobacteria bacterium]|nr:PAS-domain containing protein [Alphaproteobacteria bacterium]
MSAIFRRTWLPVVGLSITTVTVIAMLGYAVLQSWQHLEQRHADRNAALARAIASHVGLVLLGIEGELRGLREAIVADPTLLRLGDPRLAATLAPLQAWHPAIGAINAYDADGVLVASSASRAPIGERLAGSVNFTRLRETAAQPMLISAPLESALLGESAFSVTFGLRAATGEFLGMVGGLIPRRSFLARLADLQPSPATRVLLFREDGHAILGYPMADAGAAIQLPAEFAAAAWQRVAGGGLVVSREPSPTSGKDVHVSGRRVDGYPLYAAVVTDVAALQAEWWDENRAPVLTYVLLCALVGGFNVAVARRALLAAHRDARNAAALTRSEASLALIETRFATAIGSLHDGFSMWDAQGRLLTWNRRYEEVNRPLLGDFRAGDDIRSLTERYARCLPFGADDTAVAEYLEKHLAEFWNAREPTLAPTPEGGFIEITRSRAGDGTILSFHRDVTEAHRAAAARRASDALLRDAIESLGEGVTIWDAEDRLVLWNRRYTEISPHLAGILRVGVSFPEVYDLGLRSTRPELDERQFAERRRRRLQSRGTSVQPLLIEGPGGQVVEVVERRTQAGGLVCVYHDVTERRRQAADLVASEQLLHDALENIELGIVLYDSEGRLLRWNSRFAEMFAPAREVLRAGLPASDLVAAIIRGLEPDRSEAEIRDAMAARMERMRRPGGVWERLWADGRTIEVTERRIAGGVIMTINRDVTRERAALFRHAQSEARFRDGIDSMDDAFALYDADDRLVTWNSRYVELMPYTAGKLHKGRQFAELLDDVLQTSQPQLDAAQRGAWVRERLSARERGEPVEFETPQRRILRAIDRRTSEGGHVIVVQDVTEHRRLLLRISESEVLLRDAIASMADAVAVYDADMRLVLWNAAYESQRGLPGRMRPGMPLQELILERFRAFEPWRTPAEIEALLADRLENWRNPKTSRSVATASGERFEVAERRTAAGGMVMVYRDVTEQVRAAARIAESELRFRDFAETASDWFWETDAEHRFTYISVERARHGVDADAFIGRTRAELSGAYGGQISAEVVDLEARMTRHEPFRNLVYPILDPSSGDVRMIEVAGRPMRDADNRFVGYRGTGTDVTVRMRQQAELERALAAEREMNQHQRRFVSIASHEFRTPLAVIDGATQRISAKLRDSDPDVVKRLDRIRGAVSRMTEIIERTLSSARLDEGRIAFEPRPFDLVVLLREACDRQRQISPSFDIVMTASNESQIVEGDPKLIDQVMTNLLSNAVKYSGNARRIDVDLTEAGPWVEIAVRDRGVGVPAAEVPRLFTRFFRASTAEGISGTGIGLHLIKELVSLHGGVVDVDTQLGRGSTFSVRLPRRQVPTFRNEAAE